MIRRVLVDLGGILGDATERGLVAQNVVHARGKRPRNGNGRHKRALKVGVDIPSPERCAPSLARHIDEAPRFRPLLLTAIFTGLRASELRGLRWSDVDLKRGELHVRQRADRYGTIGRLEVRRPASARCRCRRWWSTPAGASPRLPDRAISIWSSPTATAALSSRNSILERGLHPAQIAAGVVDADGRQAGEICGPARAPALLCLVVHQPPRRRRARAAAQGGASAARARLHPDDGRHLRPSVPATDTGSGAGGGRGRPHRLSLCAPASGSLAERPLRRVWSSDKSDGSGPKELGLRPRIPCRAERPRAPPRSGRRWLARISCLEI